MFVMPLTWESTTSGYRTPEKVEIEKLLHNSLVFPFKDEILKKHKRKSGWLVLDF